MVSSALAGLVLAVPCAQLSTDPALLRTCLSLLRAQYASAGGVVAGTAGALLTAVVVGRVAWYCGSAAAAARRRRASHDDVLAVIARPGPSADVHVIDGDRPAVYCLPGRRRIVLTAGALTCLDDSQLDAVLAHERAHLLLGRHHLVLALAVALQRAFPGVAFFAVAARQVAFLVEVAADDAAARRAPRLTVASALLAVAAAGVPAGALGAGGSAAARRIQRLIDPPPRDSGARRAVTCIALAAAASLAAATIMLACVTIVRCPPAPYF